MVSSIGLQVIVESNGSAEALGSILKTVESAMTQRVWSLLIYGDPSVAGIMTVVNQHRSSAKHYRFIVGGNPEVSREAARVANDYPRGWRINTNVGDELARLTLATAPIPVFKCLVNPTGLGWPKSSIGVVVMVHEAYLKFLPECIESIDKQTVPATQKVLVCDGCEPPEVLPSGWKVVRGQWGNPNPGRNQGYRQLKCDWAVFFDADNIMPSTYLERMQAAIACSHSGIGFIYPDLDYRDETLKPKRMIRCHAWDHGWARTITTFDTSAAWRCSALDMVGGFNENIRCYDDYSLVMELSRLGWAGQNLGFAVIIREHDALLRRSTIGHLLNDGRSEDAMWQSRSLGIVTLFAGREALLEKWTNFISRAELPPKTALYVLDNGNSKSFSRKLDRHLKDVTSRFTHVTVCKIEAKREKDDMNAWFEWNRHQHIATLYNHILPRVYEDLVLILEDDVEPPLDAIKKLAKGIMPNSGVGATGGVYRSGSHPYNVCAALAKDHWSQVPLFDSLPPETIDVGFIGAGCTIYNNHALKQCLPVTASHFSGHPTGWDGYLSYLLRQNGYTVHLRGDIRCEHHSPAVIKYLEDKRKRDELKLT